MFESYRNKYENVRMKREDGILEVALHSGGGPLMFNGALDHRQIDLQRRRCAACGRRELIVCSPR